MPAGSIVIRGARTHNLKNIDLEIPQRKITVITGRSGSGKSSLAFNTLYAEGQRRFVESMSTYVRQFLERMERPDVDSIEGLLPAIAVEQKTSVKNARSTVATATELADSIRLFLTYCGETFCGTCDVPVRRESPESVAARVAETMAGDRIVVLAPVTMPAERRELVVDQLIRGGWYRVWTGDGEIADLKETDTSAIETLRVVMGRFVADAAALGRITESIEQAFAIAAGSVEILQASAGSWLSHRASGRFACDRCGVEAPEPVPQLFSFNSPLGACAECQGYGRIIGIDLDKVIPDRSRRLDELPIAAWNTPGYEDTYNDLAKAAKKYGIRLNVPVSELTPEEWKILYEGRGKWYGIKGFFDWLESKKYKIHVRVKLAKFRAYNTCGSCGGTRLRPASLRVRFREKTAADLFAMDVAVARRFWQYLPLDRREEQIAGHLRRDIVNRLTYLDEVGLTYLTLDRQTRTLSGGESQRINLAAALGNALTETLYVIDEPTVGLHARDSERLLAVMRRLRDAGNTVVIVEHDPTIIAGSDNIVVLGPGAGEFGGRIVTGERELDPGEPESRRTPGAVNPENDAIRIIGAAEHNLQGIDVSIPLGGLVAVTGVSGSGKSTLLRDCLYNNYQRQYRAVASLDAGRVERIEGIDRIGDLQFVDQSPIGRSTRSNPATYVKAWDDIRTILATSPAGKLARVKPSMFSFNTRGGRCEACLGAGTVTIDMQFLADVEIVCDKCDGKRFEKQVLDVTFKGRNVDAILGLTVDEAMRFFVDRRILLRKLDALRSVGLGYLRLGQATASLSGGEAQRLKLASFLVGAERGIRRLFLFDEPTTGLSSFDVAQLIRTFRRLIERGHSIVVIEHNLQLIAAADWVIDLGPEGGKDGGRLVATGTPAEIAAHPESITGRYLRR